MLSFHFFFHNKIQNGAGISRLHVQIDTRTELKYELKPQNQHSENAIVMKTIESDEIVGHVPEFLARVLATMMRSGEIPSINAACTCKPKNIPEGT